MHISQMIWLMRKSCLTLPGIDGKVDYLINNGLPLMKGIRDCTYEEFDYALRVGGTAPFYVTKLFRRVLRPVRLSSISHPAVTV